MSEDLNSNYGEFELKNGYVLYWRMTKQGREYYTEECGIAAAIWHTALVSQESLMTAIQIENQLTERERNLKDLFGEISR